MYEVGLSRNREEQKDTAGRAKNPRAESTTFVVEANKEPVSEAQVGLGEPSFGLILFARVRRNKSPGTRIHATIGRGT